MGLYRFYVDRSTGETQKCPTAILQDEHALLRDHGRIDMRVRADNIGVQGLQERQTHFQSVVTVQLFFADVVSNRLRTSVDRSDRRIGSPHRLRQSDLRIAGTHLLSGRNNGVSPEKSRETAGFSSRMHRATCVHLQVRFLP